MAQRKRILVIEDDPDLREIFHALLADDAGYEVVSWSIPPRHLDELVQVQPDLLLLDVLFGTQRLGWPLVQHMRAYPPTAAIPIILCTAALSASEAEAMGEQFAALGVQLIKKPFDIEELLTAVAHALQ